MINKNSKIYIVIPQNFVTGGTESLHQLAYELKKLHPLVYIYYINSGNATTQMKFQKYSIPVTNEILDSSENWLIVSETNSEYVNKFTNINKCIWWLSLDYYIRQLPKNFPYYFCENHKIPLIFKPIISKILQLTGKIKKDIYLFEDRNKVFHLYNCEYIRLYLKEQGVNDRNMLYLCGPISDDYFSRRMKEKKNIIAYNPAKGIEYTNKVITAVKKEGLNLEFVPIKDLDLNGVINLLSEAKLYIDFGYFPGPERIPREAVISNVNIITSTSGSAKNKIDVPIPEDCKFNLLDLDNNMNAIINKIKDLIYNYEENVSLYDDYRSKVIKQKEVFHDNIKYLLNIFKDKINHD
ncbi:hypothetical protein [Ornithinibacillus halophilus]|uniref:Uncharacterized protein n=1 Tax=Ornithinibacillus halophilus TaxID=930117 RepID=A0A1M5GIA9_9BACI|nr:hypothetical protein [Ornithinibacillus halophilus]SHG03457.1 hypothetical protein SAMN05216225_101324 [Ornithinibacillus halophilus]